MVRVFFFGEKGGKKGENCWHLGKEKLDNGTRRTSNWWSSFSIQLVDSPLFITYSVFY